MKLDPPQRALNLIFGNILFHLVSALTREHFTIQLVGEANHQHLNEIMQKHACNETRIVLEALPQSNIHHISIPLGGNINEISKHHLVKRVKRQLPLRRVKRQITDEACSIKTISTASRTSKRCIFPFIYNGKIFHECTKYFSVNGMPWCATQVFINREVVLNQWGDCDYNTLECNRRQKAPNFFKRTFLQNFNISKSAVSSVSPRVRFNDASWPEMWYINRGNGLDMNIEAAWLMGYSGRNIIVAILDDGIEWDHPDLMQNYDPKASTDLNGEDNDPYPRYDSIDSNKHGTRCAGQVAAVGNNSFCAVGIAYNAKIGGVRLLDGEIFDSYESKSLSHNRQHIDIYSSSWGPDDDGQTVEGPGHLTKRALLEGCTLGRQGKGSIFIWASGNGGNKKDDCNSDGYTTSIYTLSVSSASENGEVPWYSEPCSSTLTTTYSSGDKKDRKISTTDLHGKCTGSHTGTSASSPIAAGIIALALEANGNLTWRDVQHIVVKTSRKANLKVADWIMNGVGLNVSHSFGFGLMDAGAIVKAAKDWKTVGPQLVCTSNQRMKRKINIAARSSASFNLIGAQACDIINSLEHVQLHIQLSSLAKRGSLMVLLTSPSGTTSTLLSLRPLDRIRQGFDKYSKWPLMSVHYWGESVKSQKNGSSWKLTIRNTGDQRATLFNWNLKFYGTHSDI